MPDVLPYDQDVAFEYGQKKLALRCQRCTSEQADFDERIAPALVALYRHVLPNVPPEEIEKDVRAPHQTHLLLLRKEADVRQDYFEKPARLLRRYRVKSGQFEDYSDDSDPEEDQTTDRLLKCEDYIKNRKKTANEKFVKQLYPGLAEKVRSERADLDLIDAARIEVRLRDMLVGAVTLKHATLKDFPATNVCQLVYIGVRTRFQLMKAGRKLLQTAIQSEAGDADVFFTFAGSDALRFFRNAGLTDDPLICGRFQDLNDDWTDAVPMAKILKYPARASGSGEKTDPWKEYREQKYKTYAAEAFFVKQLVEQNAELRQRLEKMEQLQVNSEQQLALERSRCVMYEQLVQSLESQLLVNGIKPKVNQEEIIQRVVQSVNNTGEK